MVFKTWDTPAKYWKNFSFRSTLGISFQKRPCGHRVQSEGQRPVRETASSQRNGLLETATGTVFWLNWPPAGWHLATWQVFYIQKVKLWLNLPGASGGGGCATHAWMPRPGVCPLPCHADSCGRRGPGPISLGCQGMWWKPFRWRSNSNSHSREPSFSFSLFQHVHLNNCLYFSATS